MSGFKNLRTVNLTSKTKNVVEGQSVRRHGIGSIIESRFVPNAKRTIRWTINRIEHHVPFFHNKCPIFYKKRRKLMCRTDIYITLDYNFEISYVTP